MKMPPPSQLFSKQAQWSITNEALELAGRLYVGEYRFVLRLLPYVPPRLIARA